MITHTDSFQKHLNIISLLLMTVDKQPATTYITSSLSDYKLSKKDLNDWYAENFESLPLYTSDKSDEVTILSSFMHYYRQYHGNEDFIDTLGERIRELEDLERDSILLDIDEYINEWIDNVFYGFARIIKKLRKEPVFACIPNDLLVIKNLLKFYKEVREAEDIQLNFFHHISLPKRVADVMTDMLILLLSDKVELITLEPTLDQPLQNPGSTLTEASNDIFKINWLAPQQEFAELIHQLTEKGYLSLPDMSMASQARHLARIFDFSATQRKQNPDVANNLLAVLKPVQDKNLKTTTYSYLKPTYKMKFDSIPYRPHKKKPKAR
ncbi:hypothetical protein SAMN05421820_11421 [Pedobacter steynii]|uniref:Uncharacterized protein n=2 Tax=Pedobacter steynii TaxID=430522 RepID=A0A1H0IY17_9SPHI|nr:hypothetical protein SAMN05421820_11421 [Pedobacter steynii]